MSGKNTHIYFFYFWFKINEFEQKKSEKNEKFPKTKKLQAITLTFNLHSFLVLLHEKSNYHLSKTLIFAIFNLITESN